MKDLERKVADLFTNNVALTTKLKASLEVEREQQEEIAHLKELLIGQAIHVRAQVNMHCQYLYCVYLF